MAYDLLVKGGHVVDPAQGLDGAQDIAIEHGRIVALAPNLPTGEARRVLDARGLLATPGLIDIHTHIAEAIIPIAVAPDEAGVRTGVTTVCDAGSTGYANFGGLRRWVIPQARTDVFCFLHLAPVGEAVLPEIGWHQVHRDKMLEVIHSNRDVIRGIKVRATVNLLENLGIGGVEVAKGVAAEAGLPLVVHLGIDAGEALAEDGADGFSRQVLALLDKGDVLTHAFTRKQGGLIRPDGRVLPGLREAVARGVVLDIGSALGHLDFRVARAALDQGLVPTTLSTDFTSLLLNAPVPFTLPVLMSEFLALGVSLPQVVEMATVHPARVLGEKGRRGSLGVGMAADLTLLDVVEGDWLFVDSRDGNFLRGERLLAPVQVVKHGIEIDTSSRSRGYAQWSREASRMLAQVAPSGAGQIGRIP